MLLLTRDDVAAVLGMYEAIEAVERGFRLLAEGRVVMPQRAATTAEPNSGMHLAMPAYVEGDPGTLSVKIVTVFRDNPTRFGIPAIKGLLVLHDARTGEPLALMDAEHLTAMRTGAASGVATKHLACHDAPIVAIFGVGPQAITQLEAICAVRPIRQALVVSGGDPREAEFCKRFSEWLRIQPSDAKTAVHKASVICTATNSPTPVFDGSWLRPGTHINAIGAYAPTTRELDTTTIQRARVFVDYLPAALAEAGDILIPITEGAVLPDHVVGELGSVITGAVPGRTSDEDITVFKSVGVAVQDAVTAQVVYTRAFEQGVGKQITV